MSNKHLKLLTSKARLKSLLAIVVVLCLLVLTIPADLGAFLVGATSTKWDGKTLQPFDNYDKHTWKEFADGAIAYEISNAEQLAFLAAALNAEPSYSSFTGYTRYKVSLDTNGDGEVDGSYYFPGYLGALCRVKFVLTADIDLGNQQWTPIGNTTYPFRATFDGAGHTIKGLFYNNEDVLTTAGAGSGLFGVTGGYAEIHNLHVEGTVNTLQSVNGGIVGRCSNALTMKNCSFSGTVQGGAYKYMSCTGGLIGSASTSTKVEITNCFVDGEGTAITGVNPTGASNTAPEAVGGLVGNVGAGCDVTITDSYANCTVTGADGTGGLVGSVEAHKDETTVQIERSYSAGSIVSTACAGGLVGWVRDAANTTNATTGATTTTTLVLKVQDSYSVMDMTNATNKKASGLVSSSRADTATTKEDVKVSFIRCHFAGKNAKQPIMYYEDAYCTLQTVEHVYYHPDSIVEKSHTLRSYDGVVEKSRKDFMSGQVVDLLNDGRNDKVWAVSMWVEYPVLGEFEKPSLSELIVNGETIPLVDRVLEYTAVNEVEDTKGSVLVSATAAQEGVTVTVNGADTNGYVTLGIPGTTSTITITLTYNRFVSTTYTVNIYRKPTPWDGTFEVFENYESDPASYDHYEEFLNQTRVYEIANAKQLAFLMQLVILPSGAGSKEYESLDNHKGKRIYKVGYDVDKNGANETYYFLGSTLGFLYDVEFKLIADIDLGGAAENRQNWYTAFVPVGSTSPSSTSFNGILNGDGHSIRNLYIEKDTSYTGLFPKVNYGAVKNLTVYGDVTGTNYTGGIAGFMAGGADMTNCGFVGTVSGTYYVGGIGGYLKPYSGTTTGCDFILTNCWTEGTLSAKGYGGTTAILNGVGGLVGHVEYNSEYDGSVIRDQKGDGGNLTLNNCYSTMTIEPLSGAATSMKNGVGVGGLVGQYSKKPFGDTSYTVPGKVVYNNCYFAGSVKSNPFGTERLAADGTSKVTVQNGLYYKAGSVKDETVSGVAGVERRAEAFMDGTVTADLNSKLETPMWATTKDGYPVFSDLAEMLTDALGVLGTSIRTEDMQALRFKFSITDAALESNALQKIGILAAKASKLIVDEQLYAHGESHYKYVDATVYTKGGSMVSLIDDSTRFLFTAALQNLSEERYGIDYIARAYATFVDAKGQELVLYGETVGEEYFNSVYDVLDGFFNYPSTYDISLEDLLALREIYDEKLKGDEVLPSDVGLTEDTRSGGDNLQKGGADIVPDGEEKSPVATLRDKILNTGNTFTDAEIKAIKANGHTVYYVSPNGDDDNAGDSPDKAWRTVDAIKLHDAQIQAGDAVLFERGGVYRSVSSLLTEPIPEGAEIPDITSVVLTKSNVTYGSYGDEKAEKPAIYSSHKNYAWGEYWTKYKNGDEDTHIWMVYTPRSDAGSVVFDHGKAVGIKRFGVWTGQTDSNGKKIYKGFITPENVAENLTQNFEYYHDHRNGVLYLYYDNEGKAPHEVFSDIEISPREIVFRNLVGMENVRIDNLAIKYVGHSAISGKENSKGMTVTNCEIGWAGGCQWKFNTEAEGSRIGNGIDFWQTTTDVTLVNNWIYQAYDAGITPQGASNSGVSVYTNLVVRENLVEYCSYNIEWFDRNGTDVGKDHPSQWNGYYIEDNILRFAGYGFGRQRQDSAKAVSHICGWEYKYDNPLYVHIKNNIFDCSEKNTVFWRWNDERTYATNLVISGNTFYEKASKSGLTLYYGPLGEQWKATDQATLEEAIACFDSAPEKVEWLEFDE